MTSIGTKFVGIEDCAVGIRIGLLGFGEVGQALATELIAQSDAARVAVASVSAFDLLFVDPDSKPSQAALRLGVTMTTNAHALASTCDVIVCAVTAANDRAAHKLSPNSAALPKFRHKTIQQGTRCQ